MAEEKTTSLIDQKDKIKTEDVPSVEEEKENCCIVKHDNKTFLNFGCCQFDIGLAFTYIYILTSSALNIINRILFQNYNFRFNFTLSFLQQFLNLILFTFVGQRNEVFLKNAGAISFDDFWKYKYHYIVFAFIFLFNLLSNFYGNQLVKNISMFLTLKKLTGVMLFFIDLCYGKKKFGFLTILSLLLMTGGAFVIGSEKMTHDTIGYIVVFVNNTFTIVYSKYSEVFRKLTGVSNLKLLVYNSYIANPILIIGIFVSGEYKKVYEYLLKIDEKTEGSIYGLAFYLFLSCFLSLILNSSFFISNEKVSSFLTNLLVSTKAIFISIALYLFDKDKNELTYRITVGLIMSTIGAITINIESLTKYLKFGNKKGENKKIKKENKDGVELVDIEDNKNKTEEKK